MAGMTMIWGAGIALALAASPAAAGSPGAGQVQAGLAWLEGRWCGEDAGQRIDESWLPQAGGMLLGMSRTLRDGKVVSFEFMRIVVDGDAASFHVQPNGAPPTVFAMEARGEGWIRFANQAHDFPNRVEYRRNGDRLSAWIAGPGADGTEMRVPFEYRACGG